MSEQQKWSPPAWWIAVGGIGFLWMSGLTWVVIVACFHRLETPRPYLASMSYGPLGLLLLTDQVWIALIGAFFSFLTALMTMAGALVLRKLEKNTNHMKDALVSLTREEALNRGMKIGTDAALAAAALVASGPPGPPGKPGDEGVQGPAGAQGRTGEKGKPAETP